jgi:hypothetical protein
MAAVIERTLKAAIPSPVRTAMIAKLRTMIRACDSVSFCSARIAFFAWFSWAMNSLHRLAQVFRGSRRPDWKGCRAPL